MNRSRRQAEDGPSADRPEGWSYRSAICAYAIAEASQGVERRELAVMSFDGRPAAEEAEPSGKALTRLHREGDVRFCGEAVFPGRIRGAQG